MIGRRDREVTTRRDLLGTCAVGLAAGGLIALDGCGGSDSTGAALHQLPARARGADIEILNSALDLEYHAVAAYTAGIPLLSGAAARAAEQFLGQELSHAGELFGLIKEARGKPHNQGQRYTLGHPRTAAEVLALLHELERMQISTYLDAIPRLSPGPVRAAIASILANDAQHLAIVRAALKQSPLPAPLVTASE